MITTILFWIVGIVIAVVLIIRFRKPIIWGLLVCALIYIIYKLGLFNKLLGGFGI